MDTITACGTVALAVLTLVYVVLTHRIVRAQTDPCVIVYTKPGGHGMIYIVIENIGPGLARDIRFKMLDPIPRLIAPKEELGKPWTTGPLVTGIPALQPGGKRRIVWGNFGTIPENERMKTYRVLCYCKRADVNFSDSELDPVECVLDYQSFDQTTPEALTVESHLNRIGNALEALARHK